MYSQAPPYS